MLQEILQLLLGKYVSDKEPPYQHAEFLRKHATKHRDSVNPSIPSVAIFPHRVYATPSKFHLHIPCPSLSSLPQSANTSLMHILQTRRQRGSCPRCLGVWGGCGGVGRWNGMEGEGRKGGKVCLSVWWIQLRFSAFFLFLSLSKFLHFRHSYVDLWDLVDK